MSADEAQGPGGGGDPGDGDLWRVATVHLQAHAARNGVLLTMLGPVVDLLRDSRRFSAAHPGNARRALLEHERILARVQSGDTEGARRGMRGHLANTAGDIEAAIREGMLETGEESI